MTPAQLADIAARAYQHTIPWTAAQFHDTLQSPNHILTTTRHAFVLGQTIMDEAEILALATDPNVQRTGEARRAFDQFMTQVMERGVTSVFLEVAENNDPAIAFYGKCGFKTAGLRKNYYLKPDGTRQNALIMSAQIA